MACSVENEADCLISHHGKPVADGNHEPFRMLGHERLASTPSTARAAEPEADSTPEHHRAKQPPAGKRRLASRAGFRSQCLEIPRHQTLDEASHRRLEFGVTQRSCNRLQDFSLRLDQGCFRPSDPSYRRLEGSRPAATTQTTILAY